MAQVSYGTITITDTNDINRIYVEYCRSTSNQLSGSTVPGITVNWSESTPAWVDGQYLWQRAVIEKSGTLEKTYGTPVCITGAQGETGSQGSTGAAGRSLTSTTTQYTTAATNATITQSNMGNYTWSSNVPTYNSSTPAYWVRITNVYSNPSSTEYIIYKDNGITDAVKTSHDANTTASAANTTANSANTTANNANTKADNAVTSVNNLQNKLKYYWVNEVAHTNGVSGWTKPNYPVGTYAASGISGTTFDAENSSTYGYNTWYANGINLRYNAIKLGELTGSALTFYQPSTTNQGAKAMELSGSALKFYASNGTTVQAEFGGSKARVSGTINAYDGQIGNSEDNYWYIGNYLDYFENQSAIIKSHGTASIQLGDSNTWRIATNRIHTAWNNDSSSGDAFKLHFPVYDNKYWDSGLHLPTSANDKLLYIRNSSSSNTLTYLNEALEDQYTNRWNYLFYITNSGSIYAKNIYVLDDNGQATQIGGTDGVYLLKSGGTITGNLTVNGTLTGTLSGTATRVSKDLKIQLNGGTTEGTNQFTYNGSAAKTINITKSSVGLSNVENTALSTWAGSSNLTTTKVGTLAAAAVKGVDTSLTTSTTSTNLPTSAAVVNLIKQYLPLTGGNVTGAVSFGSSVSADELTAGDLVVNGNASFTNNLQANTINGVEVGSNPKFTDTVTTVTVTGSGNAVTSASASNGAVTLTKGTTFLTSYTETDPIFVASAAHGISSTDISNWNSKTSNTGTVTKVTAGTGLKIGTATSGGDITTTGTINHINSITAKTAAAQSAKTLTWGGTFTLYEEKYDAQGHITGVANYNMTMPANPNTHNTAYLYAGKSDGTANAATTNGNTYLILMDGGSVTTRRKVSGDGTVSVASDANGNITITGSAHPTSLPNPKSLKLKVYSGTTTSADTTYYGGETNNTEVSVAGATAITGISASAAAGGSTTFTLTKANGTTSTFDVTVTASVATGATQLTDGSGNTISEGSASNPVYFSAGVPVATTYSLNKTVPSDAVFTDTWISMVGATSSANGTAGYVSAPPKDGYNTKFLRADGTWVVPGGTYSLPLAASGTRGGVQIGYTTSGKNYAVQLSSEKMYVNVPWTDRYVNSAAFADDTSNSTTSPLKMTLTRAGSDTNTVTASLPKVSSSTAGVAPKGASVSTQSQSTKFLREDGTWAAPSYTTNTNTATAVDNILDGSNSGTAITYAPYTSKQSGLSLYTGTTAPDGTTRLNLNGYLYATKLYSGGAEVLTAHQSLNNYKTKQTAVTAPTAVTNKWINTLAQNANGEITATYTSLDTSGTWSGNATTATTASKLGSSTVGGTGTPIYLDSGTPKAITTAISASLGGTGQTSLINAANSLLNALGTGSSTPVDNDYYISQYVGGGTTTTTYHRRPMSALWNYISGKISSSGAYVTIATDQTITANQKTFNGAIRWGTSSKYGAAHYDSTLEAIVFSFA